VTQLLSHLLLVVISGTLALLCKLLLSHGVRVQTIAFLDRPLKFTLEALGVSAQASLGGRVGLDQLVADGAICCQRRGNRVTVCFEPVPLLCERGRKHD